jgi:hypothetical protein
MPLKPEAGFISVGGNGVLIDGNNYESDVLFFERPEFSKERLRNAPEADGRRPVLVDLPGGKQAYMSDGCLAPLTRPLGTDVYSDVYRRFDIRRWNITGHSTDASVIETLFLLARDHKVLTNRFEAHLKKAGSAAISFAELVAMQAITFTYLTTTGVTFSGMPLGIGVPVVFTDILITQFKPDTEYEEPTNLAGTTSRVLRSFALVVEQRTEVAADSVVF